MQSTAYTVSTVCVPCVRYASSAEYGKRQSECHRSQMDTLHCMLMPLLLRVQQHCRPWEAMLATPEASGRLHGTRSSRVQDKFLLLLYLFVHMCSMVDVTPPKWYLSASPPMCPSVSICDGYTSHFHACDWSEWSRRHPQGLYTAHNFPRETSKHVWLT